VIGSSSIASSAFRTISRSASDSDCHSPSTDSAMRRRSFHKEVLRQEQRVAADLFVGGVDASSQLLIVGEIHGFAKGEVFVVRSENRYGAIAADEKRALTGQLALADEFPHRRGQVENLESLFH